MPTLNRSSVRVSLFTLFMLASGICIAIPPTITVSGYMESADGTPIEGVFDYKISFYADATTTTLLGEKTSTTTLVLGVFAIPIEPPEDLLALNDGWYSFALDTDHNGLNEQDLFSGRFQITSVPFALTGQPVPFFTTHAGLGLGNPQPVVNALYLSPFVTPPGGVEFDKMSTIVLPDSGNPTRFSFGIYDAQGRAVSLSSAINLAAGSGQAALEASATTGTLRPSTLYYTGWSANQGLQINKAPAQPVPGDGYITGVVSNGMIPNSFNPQQIQSYAPGNIRVGASISLRQE